MKFSIVVPVYNVEAYLTACIESVVHQSYRDFELVLVDDGSTDASGEICDQYHVRYPENIIVVHNSNQGQLLTRSCGIEHSSGDVMLFVDSDDCLRLDALELLEKRFRETDCDMVLFNASTDEDYLTRFCPFEFSEGQWFSGERKKQLYETMIVTGHLNPLWLKAVKRHVALAVPENYKYFGLRNTGDLLYAMPMLSASNTVSYMEQNLYFYRLHPGSIIHTYNPARHKSIKAVHKEMEKYIDVWGMPEMHPQHFAREVKGWIECLKQVLLYASREELEKMMIELAEDEYFRRAYQLMAPEALSEEESLLACLLYKKKFGLLKIVKMILQLKLKLKSILRK